MKARRPDSQDHEYDNRSDDRTKGVWRILNVVLTHGVVRGGRPALVIVVAAFFVKQFIPSRDLFVWLIFFLSLAGVWYVLGLIAVGLERAFSAMSDRQYGRQRIP